ncbi:SAM-dependent methyltransferase [Nocardia pseudobrasiliensis]|uniref:S-adenosyl methyltransferase n=1 Tax=Nocardia pseudobrasiliensis TaxID=45979 RepID=A0A370HWU0_9NOCA|nr:SAM-dependent methyltransferase [Nocardia pseudobrasiliensis]RDI62740.1 S-adenosyl methyltransferase [Nocardia pseudobrasiliensis]
MGSRYGLDETIDMDTPNIARMYDYVLGGGANFEIDREAAEAIPEGMPGSRFWARSNRGFVGRAVAALCEMGIDQFLDLGSGAPTVGNPHEIALRHNPHARIAYVERERVAVEYAQKALEGHPQVSMTWADLRDIDSVLSAPSVTDLIDFGRPVAILAMAVLDLLEDIDPALLIAAYRDACPPGSALGLSHAVAFTLSLEEQERVLSVMRRTNTPGAAFKTTDDVAELLRGYTVLQPGIVALDLWRPENPVDEATALRANYVGAVGLKES